MISVLITFVMGFSAEDFSFRVEMLKDTVYQMMTVVPRVILKNVSGDTLYVKGPDYKLHLLDSEGEELERRVIVEDLVVRTGRGWRVMLPGDSAVNFGDEFFYLYAGSVGLEPGEYIVRCEGSVSVKGYGELELPEVEDTFWVVEPEGEEREAFEFLRKFYSPSMGYSLEISRRILRDKLRQMGETSEKPSKIIQAGLLEYYREFLRRYPNSVYTPIVLDLYEFTCYGAGCPKEEWFGAYRRLILDFPDTYEAYTGVRGLTELVKGSGAKVTEEEVISILREVVEKHPNSLAALGVRKVISEEELEKQ